MKLYHGSIVEVRKPSLRYGRKRTDFGKGFYTTTQKEQAERWAEIKKDRAKALKAVVSVYEVDNKVLSDKKMNVRSFNGVDKSWLTFVVNCRKAIPHSFDLVLGPVANDQVFITVNLYESGVIDAQTAIRQLRSYKTYDQLSFHTKKVIGKLIFIGSYEVMLKTP